MGCPRAALLDQRASLWRAGAADYRQTLKAFLPR